MNIFKKLALFTILTLTLTSCMKSNYNYEEWDIVAVMKTTNGTINILLETEMAPITSNNFIGLASKWYYDWIIFHRVIKDFMIQWWDPDGTGMWGTSIYWEKFEDEFHPDLRNNKYTISMANAWKNTNWSQFFINVADNNFLDDKHSVFWEVVEGIENVDKISKTSTDNSDRPNKEVKIISLKIKEYSNWKLKDYEVNIDDLISKKAEIASQKLEAKKNLSVKEWDNIKAHYTWTFEDGEVFDSSYDRWQTIDFQVSSGQMIPWFDAAVVWMKIWEKKSITLTPSEAYWEYDPENKQVYDKSDLFSYEEAGFDLVVWTKIPTQFWEVEILDADETTITIDWNHPMAWKVLNFDIEIVDIN